MKRIMIALTALGLAGCEVNEEVLQAGTQITLGVGAAAISEINSAGFDPIQISEDKLLWIKAGCDLAVTGSGLLTGDVLTAEGLRVCELVRLALASAPDAASELSPPVPVKRPVEADS